MEAKLKRLKKFKRLEDNTIFSTPAVYYLLDDTNVFRKAGKEKKYIKVPLLSDNFIGEDLESVPFQLSYLAPYTKLAELSTVASSLHPNLYTWDPDKYKDSIGRNDNTYTIGVDLGRVYCCRSGRTTGRYSNSYISLSGWIDTVFMYSGKIGVIRWNGYL